MVYTLRHDPPDLLGGRARRGAGAAARPDADACRTRPRGDGAAVRRRLESAPHRDPSALPCRDRARGAQAVPADGPPSLRRGRPGPPPDTARRAQVTAALDALLGQDRTWTAAQLATALRDHGIRLSTRQTRKYLQQMGSRWRRTVRTLRHKQDPARVAQAVDELADFKKKRPRARSA